MVQWVNDQVGGTEDDRNLALLHKERDQGG